MNDMAKHYLEQQKQVEGQMSGYVDGVKTHYKSYFESSTGNYKKVVGQDMPVNVQSAMAKSMRGTDDYMIQNFGVSPNGYRSMMEAKEKSYTEGTITPGDNFFGDSFVKHIFDMITTVTPSSVLDEFVTIQGMDKSYGEIWYMDIIKGDAKSPSTANSNYIGANGELNTDYNYTGEKVIGQTLGTGAGAPITFTSTLGKWVPVRTTKPFKITYTIGATTYQVTADPATGAVTGTGIDTGSAINYTTGAFTIVFSGNVTGAVTADYEFIGTKAEQAVSVEVKLRSKLIQAQRRALNTKWIVDSAVILQKDFGRNIEKDLLDQVISGVMHEIASEVMFEIYNGATGTTDPISFSKTPPSTEIPYLVHRAEILGKFNTGSLNVEKKVKKVKPNWIAGGFDLMDVLGGLPKDKYNPVDYGSNPPVGIHVAGNTGRFKIIQNLDFTDDKFVIGTKVDNNWLLAGYVLAWYIPMMVTDIFHTRNLGVERDMFTYYGREFVNQDMFAKGEITE